MLSQSEIIIGGKADATPIIEQTFRRTKEICASPHSSLMDVRQPRERRAESLMYRIVLHKKSSGMAQVDSPHFPAADSEADVLQLLP